MINIAKQRNTKAYKYYYIMWFNDFYSIEGFAAYFHIPVQHARRILLKGRVLHQDKFGHH